MARSALPTRYASLAGALAEDIDTMTYILQRGGFGMTVGVEGA
jgi:hypothetical protein